MESSNKSAKRNSQLMAERYGQFIAMIIIVVVALVIVVFIASRGGNSEVDLLLSDSILCFSISRNFAAQIHLDVHKKALNVQKSFGDPNSFGRPEKSSNVWKMF